MAAHMNTITPGLGEGYKRFQQCLNPPPPTYA
jgi:hypothetical protein